MAFMAATSVDPATYPLFSQELPAASEGRRGMESESESDCQDGLSCEEGNYAVGSRRSCPNMVPTEDPFLYKKIALLPFSSPSRYFQQATFST